MIDTDFKPVDRQLSLHGLGFIQVVLPQHRLHVWHPELPRRKNADVSPVHNHRFSFRSTVLVGTQINRRYKVWANDFGGHELISHDGPRKPNGSRLSYVSHTVSIESLHDEVYRAGQSYVMPMLEYHETPNDGMVVTLMEKLEEGTVHASSITEKGVEFDQEFDRFQMSEDQLWSYVREAMKS